MFVIHDKISINRDFVGRYMTTGSRAGGAIGIADGLIGLRESIADPTNTDVVPTAGRAVCRALASTGYNQIPLVNRTGPGFACEPYWENEGIDPPVEVPPFQGGQCATSYTVRVRVRFRRLSGAEVEGNFERIVTGPVRGVTVGPSSSSDPNFNTTVLIRADGGDVLVGSGQCPPVSVQRDCPLSAVITEVIRRDGLPDDCGDPPGDSQPGPSNPGTPFGTPQPTIIGGDTVNITVGSPRIDLSGGTYFPVTLDVGGVSIAPTLQISGGIGSPDTPAPPPPPTRTGEPVEGTDDAGDVDDSNPDEEDGFVTIGYEWRLTGLPDNLSVVPGPFPRPLLTAYGNVALRFEDGTGREFWGDNLTIRAESGSVMRSDASLRVRGVRYTKRPDIGGITLLPIRAQRRV